MGRDKAERLINGPKRIRYVSGAWSCSGQILEILSNKDKWSNPQLKTHEEGMFLWSIFRYIYMGEICVLWVFCFLNACHFWHRKATCHCFKSTRFLGCYGCTHVPGSLSISCKASICEGSLISQGSGGAHWGRCEGWWEEGSVSSC